MNNINKEKKRFGLLLAARDSEYVKKIYGGYFHLFVDAFGDGDEEDEEKWELFNVVDGEFPDMDELESYEAFVVSGSPYDAYGNEDWILKLCLLLQALYRMKKKVLGICFGHQVLCRALGGKVGKSYTGWDVGVRSVKIIINKWNEMFPNCCNIFDHLDEIPQNLSIIECHQDEVWEAPEGAEVIGCSEKTGVEMFCVGSHILGIQGHPEYTSDILVNIIDRLLATDCIEKGFAGDAKAKLSVTEPDRNYWQLICKGFLKGQIIE